MSGILVLGREGQLARSLAERAPHHGLALTFVGRPDVDLAEPETLRRAVREAAPQVIVNAAAHTAVDQAEDEPDVAHALNVEGPRALAEAARETRARLVHVSTDYVFDGSGERPWREDDPTGPRSVYGRTKLDGEEAIQAALPDDHVILRTAWVYSPFGKNFVKTMLALAPSRPKLNIVGDQRGNPTSSLDLADGILTMIGSWREDPRGLGRTYHLAGTGSASWADFAREIFALSRARGGPAAEVEAIATADYPAKAPRPLNSRLDSRLFAETFGYRAPRWQESLAPVVARLLGGASPSD